MSKRSKLEKFAENLSFVNVFENFRYEDPRLYAAFNTPVDFRGCWSKSQFHNEWPLVLELACGRGEYSLGLARLNRNRNYIGVDIKGARIWQGASRALEEGMNHVAFVRTRIELITAFFGPSEVDEIWITFPDPFPRASKSNRRLVSPHYLSLYKKILKPGAVLHLKTDNTPLYEFGLESIAHDSDYSLESYMPDVYAESEIPAELHLKTYYEKLHLVDGRTIKYIRWKFNPQDAV